MERCTAMDKVVRVVINLSKICQGTIKCNDYIFTGLRKYNNKSAMSLQGTFTLKMIQACVHVLDLNYPVKPSYLGGLYRYMYYQCLSSLTNLLIRSIIKFKPFITIK